MKFSIAHSLKANRPERVVDHPGEFDADGRQKRIALRPPLGSDETSAAVFAKKYAKAHGAEDASRGDTIYDVGEVAAFLAACCADPDSPADKREPYFASADDVIAGVPRETRLYLYEQLEAWAAETSPFRHQMTAAQLLDSAREEAASQDDRFFSGLGPGMQRAFAHSLACLVVSSPEAMSLLFLLSKKETETSSETTTVQ